MKKVSTLFVLVTLLFTKLTSAQTPSWLWAIEQSGGGCYTQGQQLSVSPTGGIYISGRYAGGITLGGLNTTASGESAFSAKLDGNGNTMWFTNINSISTNYYNYGYGRDYKNNTFPTGPGYIAKVDSNGVEYNNTNGEKWPINLGSGTGYDVKADKGGNIYLTGDFTGTLTIGAQSVTSYGGGADMFLAKMDSAGNCLWLAHGGGSGYDGGRAVAIDGSGNVYVCGSYSNDGTFGAQTAPVVVGSFPSVFIAKYDALGNALRVSTGTNAGFDNNYQFWRWEEIAVDSSGNAYISGNFQGSAQFGGITLPAANDLDIFVAKCHFDGKWEWAKNVKSTAPANENQAIGIALDKANDVYIVGDFFGTCQFGNFSVTAGSSGGSPFVAKYANSTGDVQWIQTSTGSGNCSLQGVGVAADGSVYVDGNMGGGGTATFGSANLTDVTGCSQNIFVAKLGTVPPRAILPVLNKQYCPGGTVDLPYTLVGTFDAGNVFDAQLSDSTGNFINYTDLGSVTSNTDGTISITIPGNIPPGHHYFIRIVSTSPATSSYALPNGNVVNGNYNTGFFITIGGANGGSLLSKDTAICSGASVQLQATGASSYSWSPAKNLTCTTCSNPVANPSSTTTYAVNITTSGCPPVNDSVVISVNPSVPVVITSPSKDTSVCSGQLVQLSATGSGPLVWSPKSALNDSTIGNPTATPAVTTTYTVTGGACTTAATVVVSVGNSAVGGYVAAARDTICSGTPGNLVLSGNSSDSIRWQISTTDTNSFVNIGTSASIDTAKYRTDPLTQSTWFRVIVGIGNCTALSNSLQLVVPPTLTASFTSTTTGNTISFNSSGSIGNINNYFWDFGDGATSNDSNPTHTYAKDTIYNPCLTIYDGSNCSYTFCRTIALGIPTVSADGSWTIYPNPFGNQLNLDANPAGAGFNSHVQSIEMVDVLGRVVVSEATGNMNSSAFQLNTSSLAKGMYFLMIKTADADYVQKVVKE